MSPKPPVNLNGVRWERPRFHGVTPSAFEDRAYDAPEPDRPFADRHPLMNAVGWLLVLAIVVMVGTFVLTLLLGPRVYGQTLPTTAPTTRPAVTFPALVSAWYYPPIENLATVKARGCNAVIGPELGNPPRCTPQQWCGEANRLGLGVIGDAKLLAAGYTPPNLIGWIVRDEPTSANHNYPPEQIAAEAAAFRAVRADLPVLCSHAGDKLTSAGARDNPLYERYAAAVDVSLEDWYPINRQVDRYWTGVSPPLKVRALNYLKARGAPAVGSIVETSWQKLNRASPLGRGPTPDEYERQVNDALAAGARVIVHFSTAEAGYPWPLAYDPTPPDVVARITAVNARLNPPVLVDPEKAALRVENATLKARIRRAADLLTSDGGN